MKFSQVSFIVYITCTFIEHVHRTKTVDGSKGSFQGQLSFFVYLLYFVKFTFTVSLVCNSIFCFLLSYYQTESVDSDVSILVKHLFESILDLVMSLDKKSGVRNPSVFFSPLTFSVTGANSTFC